VLACPFDFLLLSSSSEVNVNWDSDVGRPPVSPVEATSCSSSSPCPSSGLVLPLCSGI